VPSPNRISVTYNGKTWSGGYTCSPDAVVEVFSAYGSAREDLEMSDDGPKAQAERMLLEIVQKGERPRS
jgi:hypothetical protein